MGAALRRLKVVVTAVAVSSSVLGAGLADPAGAEGVFSGACALVLDVWFSAPVVVAPEPRSLFLSGGGTCVVNGTLAPISLHGTLATTPVTGGYSCAGGVSTGTGVVDIDTPGFPAPVVQLAAVQAGGEVTLAVVALTVRFDGLAALAQDPVDLASCPVGGTVVTTWTGAMVFQDPDPSPVR